MKVSGIQVNAGTKILSVGKTIAAPSVIVTPSNAGNQSVTWSSADPSVATVDTITGEVHGVAAGTTTISTTAVDGSNVTGNYSVMVADGPIAYYTFDGNLNDSTGVGAGTVIGNRLNNPAGGSITYDTGVSGQAAVFDGQTGIQLPNGLISGSSYTVSMSVYMTAENQYTTAFFGFSSGKWISVVPRGPGASEDTGLWSDGGSDTVFADSGVQIPLNQWVDLTFVVDNGAATVYINGVQKYSGAFPNVFTNDQGIFALGVNYWDPAFTGRIDELRVYDRALSNQEVQGLMHSAQTP
nr:LamG-like jellyroll fold domain-containing protein [Gorillibacterium massiliense]